MAKVSRTTMRNIVKKRLTVAKKRINGIPWVERETFHEYFIKGLGRL